MEATPSHTIISRLKRIHQRAVFTGQHRTRAPALRTQERNPKGGKKSEGPLTDMKSIASSSDAGGSAKTFGYIMNVSRTMAPNRTIIPHRDAVTTGNASRCI